MGHEPVVLEHARVHRNGILVLDRTRMRRAWLLHRAEQREGKCDEDSHDACYRCTITPLAADPTDGWDAFRCWRPARVRYFLSNSMACCSSFRAWSMASMAFSLCPP